MQARHLNRSITIEKKQVVKDANNGTETEIWVPFSAQPGSPTVANKFYANVWDMPPSRSEAVTNGIATARQQTKFTIRYREGIDSSMRIVLHGAADQIYQIVGGPAAVDNRSFLEMVGETYSPNA